MINLRSKKVLGILWYELKMLLRSWLFWIVLVLANTFSLIMPTPINYRSPEDVRLFPYDWWRAGEAVTGLSFITTLLAVFLVANRILRDRDLRTKELIWSRQVNSIEYVIGKYFGSLTALTLIALPSLIGTPLLKRVFLENFMNPWPMITALLTMYLPPISFVAAFSLTVTTLIKNKFFSYVLFATFWYLETKYIDMSSPIWGILNNLGLSPYYAFFSTKALGLSEVGKNVSARVAVFNVLTLFVLSALLLTLLIQIEKRRRVNDN